MWKMEEIDAMVEKGDCLSTELKDLFEQHPEKKEEYKHKVFDSQMSGGGRITTHKWCDTCMFCDVIEPIGRQPQTRYCKIYGAKDTHGKPDEVIYEGAKCEFYEKEKKQK